MRRHRAAALPVIVGVAATMLAPAARANDVVTYEVVSESIPQARWSTSVTLPWRLDVTLDDAGGPTGRAVLSSALIGAR